MVTAKDIAKLTKEIKNKMSKQDYIDLLNEVYYGTELQPAKIYFVVSVCCTDDDFSYICNPRKRRWGWFYNLKDAEKAIELNLGDLWEDGYYTHCLVEEIESGILAETKVVSIYEPTFFKRKLPFTRKNLDIFYTSFASIWTKMKKIPKWLKLYQGVGL